ncbi:MAG: hypothetical protein KGK33_07810, partial [Hyphomicrobiales bacterium]|nr:hypothetical protein [Hyphomicrobiales bacterium]
VTAITAITSSEAVAAPSAMPAAAGKAMSNPAKMRATTVASAKVRAAEMAATEVRSASAEVRSPEVCSASAEMTAASTEVTSASAMAKCHRIARHCEGQCNGRNDCNGSVAHRNLLRLAWARIEKS